MIEDLGENRASVVILKVIKSDSTFNSIETDTIETYLYKPTEKIGDEYIFSNPHTRGPSFETLLSTFEFEVTFLADTARKIENIEEALKMVEGLSRHSNQMGFEYISAHSESCFESLTARFNKFRQDCFNDPEIYFANYRISNLATAVLELETNQSKKFIFAQIDSVSKYPFKQPNWNTTPYRGETPQGEMLRTFLSGTEKNKRLYDEILVRYLLELQTKESYSNIYFAYAFSFIDFKRKIFKELNENQKNLLALGMAYAASWNKYWFRREKRDFLIECALKYSTNSELTALLKEG